MRRLSKSLLARLAEFDHEVHSALVSEFHHLTKSPVWPKEGFDNNVFDLHRGDNDSLIRNQAHAPDHGVELQQTVDVFRLVRQGFPISAHGLRDEVTVQRFQFRSLGLSVRMTKLRALRQP